MPIFENKTYEKEALREMYVETADISQEWMGRLFPTDNKGCINFGYWESVKEPLTFKKRVEAQKRLYGQLFKRFKKHVKSCLEVGCGRGHGIGWLKEKGYEGFGIDLLEEQIHKSIGNYPELAPYFKVGEAENIPFKPETFDCVYSLEAAQHFISFPSFCEEAFRVLKRPGQLVVSTYFLRNSALIDQLAALIPTNLEGYHHAIDVKEAMAAMQASGFKILPPFSIGKWVFPHYAHWQKIQMQHTPLSALSIERTKWASYYTGGGSEAHPWAQAYHQGLIDYYILQAYKF